MLNLLVAMVSFNRLFILFLYSLLALSGMAARLWAAPSFQAQQVEIDSPKGGDVLQGVVTISGSTDVAGFHLAEIAFAYQTDPTHTWFLIQPVTNPVNQGTLATWDTTTITDGDYRIRVRVILQDGTTQESEVAGLRVRNYTAIETTTPPAGGSLVNTPAPTATSLPDFQVNPRTPSPLPTNPAQLTSLDLQHSVLRGMLAVVGGLILAGIYIGLRAVSRR